ncbi:helix-turn-helix domain-containing protein [Lentzea flava]|uniref:helix-turn-helix domain-containing protein n=1 Tax=Lentzea flava TaxID=103732 RepID=UPI001E57F7F3|nr:helix-turn-helix transcriptional regulator [Lentzea flava]
MPESIEIFPVVVLTRVFAARPSSVPEMRDFIRRCSGGVAWSESDNRELNKTIMEVLLAAAGPGGRVQVSCRTYPDRVEFDVLPSVTEFLHPSGRHPNELSSPSSEASDPVIGDEEPATFAEWITAVLRREGITREAAARQLGVSVKTVSRWAGGETEPRLRELRRVQDRFGHMPFR